MRVLVTGGAGFIGRHICERLLKDGHEVVCMDNLSNSSAPPTRARFTFVHADVRDISALTQALVGCSAASHHAATTSVPCSLTGPARGSNEGFVNLLKACHNIGVRRVVFVSPSSVYDDGAMVSSVADKEQNEEMARIVGAHLGLETVGLRYFNVFGARQSSDGPVPQFVKDAMTGHPLLISGDGSRRRNFTHVDNVVEANMRALMLPTRMLGNVFGRTLDIGAGQAVTMLQLAQMVLSLAGRDPTEITHGPPSVGDFRETCADSRGAYHALCSWTCHVSLEQGLGRMLML